MCSIMGYDGKDITLEKFEKSFEQTVSRGPDDTRIVQLDSAILGFHRLAIMGLSQEGMQPFSLDKDYAVCNGEIYGFRKIKESLKSKYEFKSDSDCEIILPLYREMGTKMFATLDSEFAMIIYDSKKDGLIAARDPIGIRPLFYGYSDSGKIVFASEAKTLSLYAKKFDLFRRDIITKTANLRVIAILQMSRNIRATNCLKFLLKFAKNFR